MSPDERAQVKQVDEHALALRTDLESIRAAAACDPKKIRLAEKLPDTAVQYAREAIGTK